MGKLKGMKSLVCRDATGFDTSVQFSCSVVSDFFDFLNCSTPGFPVHHQLLELAQTHVHQVGDVIQPSHPLSSPSRPAFTAISWVVIVVQSLSHVELFATPWTQHTRLPCPPSPGACSNSCPLSAWCHPTISSSVSPSLPAFNLSQNQGLFQWVSSSCQVAKVLEFQL